MSSSLSETQIGRAAELLTSARLSISQIESLGDLAPPDLSAAHRIADAHADLLGWSPIGWKVGATSTVAMQMLSCAEPFAGRIFDGTVYGSQILHPDAMIDPFLETEFAFLLAKDLPPRDSLYSLDELKDATHGVMPAFELVTSRFTDWTSVGYLNLIADSGLNGGVVLGHPVSTDELPNLAEVDVSLTIDGAEIATGSGAHILGDPWRSLEWLANHLSARQIGLRTGEFVMSGTCSGITPFPIDSTAVATFSGLGQVAISRTAG